MIVSWICCMTTFFAQTPVNDNCSGAISIPSGSVPPCGTGIQTSTVTTITGDITSATPGIPYAYQTNCSGSSTTQNTPANDVWYSFIATGNQVNISINSAFSNPNLSFYSGSCSSLGGGVGACAVGSSGSASLQVNQIVPGNVYFLQVSGATNQTGTFTLNLNQTKDCSDCLQITTLSVNPMPVNGSYSINTTVNICFHINSYKQINTNWLHGVQVTLGSGWNTSSLITNTPTGISTTGYWTWLNTSYTANSQTWTPGWYWETSTVTVNPADNFGDGGAGASITSTSNQWNFCLTVTTKSVCCANNNLFVKFKTSSDGESGSWSNPGCIGDPPTIFNAVLTNQVVTGNPNNALETIQSQLTIFPNPGSGKFTANYQLPAKGKWILIITDVLGRIITSEDLDQNSQENNFHISSPGFYIITLTNGLENLSRKIIVE